MNGVPTRPPLQGDRPVEMWRDTDGRLSAVSFVDAGRRCLHIEGVGTFWLDAGDSDVYATLTESGQPDVAIDAFQRMVVPIALHVRGRQVLHASAILDQERVVAFCGPSGAGKSTLAYALAQRGHLLWADDAVAFEPSDPPRALQLPFRARLRPDSAAWFGDGSPDQSSGLFTPPPLPQAGQQLGAIITLERGEDLDIERLTPAAAFPALLPHAYYFMLDDSELLVRLIGRYLELAARVPVLRLRFSPGLENLDAIVKTVERAVAST